MALDNQKIEDIEKMVIVAGTVLTLITKLINIITGMINDNKEMKQEDKDNLIAKIKKAQESIPEWI